jgi:hypothetical protein
MRAGFSATPEHAFASKIWLSKADCVLCLLQAVALSVETSTFIIQGVYSSPLAICDLKS